MPSQRVRNRSHQALPTLWAAFACADAVAEATRRQLGRSVRSEPSLAQSSGQTFVLFGRGLQRQLRALLTADGRYQRRRARQRRYQARRDLVARRLQREFVQVRRYLKGLLGYRGACEYLGFSGPSPREPTEVFYQVREAVLWAQSRQVPEGLFAGLEHDVRQRIDHLDALCRQLDLAMGDVARGRCEVDSAMLDQRQAMRDFDRFYKESARAMESQLIFVGLPSLAEAVRPGVGRRGRPLKERPVDLYPDLVERVRAEGLIDLDPALSKPLAAARGPEAARSLDEGTATEDPRASRAGVEEGGAGLETGSRDLSDGQQAQAVPACGDAAGEAGLARLATGSRNGSAGGEKIEQSRPERSRGEEKTDRVFLDRSAGEEIIEQALPERSAEKAEIEQAFRERASGEEKIEQAFPESAAGHASGVLARLTLPPPVAACGRGRAGQAGYRIGRRRRPLSGPSAAGEKKPAAPPPPWWARLLRAGPGRGYGGI